MAKSIKFIATGHSNALGNFSSDDIARNIDDALAAHLVNDAKCAEYINDAPAPVTKTAAIERPRRGRKPATPADLAGAPRSE